MGFNSILKNNTPEEIKKRNKGSTDGGAALAALSEEEKINAREKKRSADYKEKLLTDAVQMRPYQREKLQSSLEGVKSGAASDVKKISDVLNQNEKNRLMEARDAEISGLYGKNVSNDFLMRKAAEIEKQIQGLRPSSYDEQVEADRLNGLLKKILSVVEYRKSKRATKISQSREENAINAIYSIHGNDFTWDDAEKIIAGNKQKLKNKGLTYTERIQLESENKTLEKYSFQLKDNGYKRLSGNYDFAIHSEPVSSPVKVSAKRFREDEEFIYGYINDLDMVSGKSVRNHVVLSDDYEWFTKLNNMTSEEVATYNYISKTQDKESGRVYIEHLMPELNARAQQILNEKIQRDIKKSNAKAALYSAGTVALAPVRAIEGAAASVEDLGKVIRGERIDPYSNSHSIGNTVSAIRGATAGKIDNFWGQFFYNTGMSVADNVVNTLTFGGITKAVGGSMGASADAIANATSNVVSAAMASDSVANAIVNNKQRGMSDKKALALAFAQGFVEYGTEKLSLDAILREPKTSFTKLLKAANAEGTEEVVSGSFNLVTDLIFNGSEAEIVADIKKLQDKGYRDFDAAMFGVLGHLGEAYLSGAVSGAAMSAGYNAAFNRDNIESETDGDDVQQEPAQPEVLYQIKSVPDTDKRYVKADRQVITGTDPTKWAEDVKTYIDNSIRKGEDVSFVGADGDVLTITADTSGKARFRNEVQIAPDVYRPMGDDEYAAKLRAETHIDELSQVSKRNNEKTKPDEKNHPFAKDGWHYRTAYFEDFDGQYYRVTISVGENGEVNTVYNVGKLKEAQSPRGSKAKQQNTAYGASASNSSITQSKENSNKNVDAFDEIIAMGTNEHAEIARKKIAQAQGNGNNEVLNSIEDMSDSVGTTAQSVSLTPEQLKLKGKFEKRVGRMGYTVISEPKRIVPKGTIGYVDFKNREIYISPGHFSESLLAHELTHIIDRGYNGKYVKSLISFFKEDLAKDWNETHDKVKAKYEKLAEDNDGFTYTESTLEAETLAEMCSKLSDEKYLKLAKDMNVSTIKQISLMLRYMGSKIKMFFGDESRAHKMKIASLKWQMALYKATKAGAINNKYSALHSIRLTEDHFAEYLNAGTRKNLSKHKAASEGRKVILVTEKEIVDFIHGSIEGASHLNTVGYGKVNERLSDDVKRSSNGKINIDGNFLELVPDDIKHAYNEHLEAKEDGDIDLSMDDFENIPYYIDNYDEVLYAIRYKNGNTRICLSKKISRGRILIIEAVSKGRGSVAFKNMIGVSEEKYAQVYEKMYKKRNGTNTRGSKDSNNSLRDELVSNNSISQDGTKDNKNISTNDDMLMAVSDDEGSAGVDTSAIEEEISLIDEALAGEGISSADRVALIKEKVRLKRQLNDGRDAHGEEDTPRTKGLEGAVEAYRESGDTSGIPTRRWAATSKKYYDAKAADIEAELKQIDEALSNSDNLSDMEYDELRNSRDALLTQWREAAKKNSVFSEVLDILDEIDTAARPNHTWVNEIAGWLADKKNLIKFGTYNLNDIERNFKMFFGKHFKTAYDKIIQPLYDSKKAYTEGVTEYADRLKREIVDGLGIKKGSKMSAAVMWLGEGQKPVSKRDGAALEPYTYKDCVAEFGEDAAKKIQKATEIFREMYNELLDQVNETRAMLYPNNPDKLIPRRANYFRHFQEMSQGFEGLKNILQTNIGIDPMLVGTSETTKPKSKWQSYAQKRMGNSTTYDAVGGFLDYLPAAQYSIHIDPNIVNVRSLAYDLASAKAKENGGSGNPNANGFIAYLQRYANSLAGKTTSHFDRAIQDSNFGRTAMAVVSWLNNKTKASAVLGNINSVLSQVTNIKNVIGKIEHQSDVVRGALEALAGINPNSEIATRYDDSGFLKERYIDKVFSQFDTGWDRVNPVKWAADLLGFADEIGTRITWNAAYNEAVRKNIANPVQYADNFTRASVAGRGIGEEALIFRSQVAKMFLPFRTEVLNDLRVQQDILFGEKYDIWEKNTDNSADNKNYVDLSFDNELVSRVEGMQGAGKYKVIRDFILEQLGDKDIVFSDGLVAKVDRSDALHIANKSANNKTTYISKLNELIQKSKLYATDTEVEHNKFNEFKYYRVIVKLEGKGYPIYLNVGRAKNGDGYHLYDITKKIGKSQSIALERVDNDLRSEIDFPIDYSISQDEGKINKKVSTEPDKFDQIIAMGKKVDTSTVKRVKNIMQLYVASMVVNAVLAAIKSDEFDPLDEAKEGYEENGPLGALVAVMGDYADGTSDPVAFDPIYDIVTGIYQGVAEGESTGGKVGRSAQRTVQNLAGDLVSNNPFSTAVMGMIGFDNDASDLLFNGNVYVPGGMGMPLAGNAATVLRELGQGDYASAAAATVKPFLPLGTQIDRSIKGIYDYTKGYATNEAVYERMTGTDGDLKYLIEPSFGNAVRSALFGPGAFSAESDAFYNDKTRKFTPEEQAEILSHKDYASRKVTFDDILAMNVYDSERDERKTAAAAEFFLGKEGTVLHNLYMSGVEAAVPYKNMAGDASFTDQRTGKKYTLNLKADELERLTGELCDKIAARFERANGSEVFASLSQEEQVKYLNGVADAEYKQAKIKALYDNGQMDYDDYFRLESSYMEAEAKRDRVLYVDDTENYVKFNAADVVGQYISYSDFPVSEEGYEQLQQWRDYATTRKPDDVDAELLRLWNATGSDQGINVSGNPYGIISYSKSKVDYKIEMPDNQIYALCDEVDAAVRSALSALFAKATYRNATAEVQKDLVASVKRDVRDGIKAKYKAKYKSVKVDDFDRIVNMKR